MAPPINRYGGKGKLAKFVKRYLPRAGVVRYVEPYVGAGWVLFSLEPYPIEVINDLDEHVVTTFRVLQDEKKAGELERRLAFTPYSRAEYERAVEVIYSPESSDVDIAWATIVTSLQGFSSTYPAKGRWSKPSRESNAALSWARRVERVWAWYERLRRVAIERRDALEVIQLYDSPSTLFYLDPPYVPDTRSDVHAYRYEADLEHHERLVDVLLGIEGMAVLSGYAHEVYLPLEEAGWERRELETHASANPGSVKGKRVEALWISPRALAALGGLFQPLG